jgi:hypothetical protein
MVEEQRQMILTISWRDSVLQALLASSARQYAVNCSPKASASGGGGGDASSMVTAAEHTPAAKDDVLLFEKKPEAKTVSIHIELLRANQLVVTISVKHKPEMTTISSHATK